jgi:hypothetical protein
MHGGGTSLLFGETHTALLRNSTALPAEIATTLLRLRPGAAVAASTRPGAWLVSPDVAVGISCRLPTATDVRVDGVGTVLGRVTITGGRVVQASARMALAAGSSPDRRQWSYYLARPGIVEVLRRRGVDEDNLLHGFLSGQVRDRMDLSDDRLDLGSICERMLDQVQQSRHLDRDPPLTSRRTRLRYGAVCWSDSGSDGPGAQRAPVTEFALHDEIARTLRITSIRASDTDLVTTCEEIALHDWLLTALLKVVETARTVPLTSAEVVARFGPLLDLFHLWMPNARTPRGLRPVWAELEHCPGFSRQWRNLAAHVRDNILLAAARAASTGPALPASGPPPPGRQTSATSRWTTETIGP